MTSLYKCDFHGAHIKVISSKCCSYVMVAGVIILETKNTFQIIGVNDKLKSKYLNFFVIHKIVITMFTAILLDCLFSNYSFLLNFIIFLLLAFTFCQ